MKKLSVVITTCNSARTINKCLEAVKWANEIIVVDSESRDGTIEICREYPNCRLLQNPSPYPNIKRNYGYEQASGDWILTLDSDEIIPPKLSEEIRQIVSSDNIGYDGYLASGRELIFGKWLYYIQGQKHRPQRYFLFKKGYLRYKCKRIHEIPLVTGSWGYLKNWYDHEPFSFDISTFINKMDSYIDKDMQMLTLEEAAQRFRWHRMLFLPLKSFLIMYIKNQGFRDGAHGLIMSILDSFYIFVEYAKLWELIYHKNISN
jgi:glycosyltransferase involved in cell wall biosynthesis